MSTSQSRRAEGICVELALYGVIARYGGGRHIWQGHVRLPEGSKLQDLFDQFRIPAVARGYVFHNAVLCDMPGIGVAGAEALADGDHVGIFSADRAWPYQYRQGVPVTDALARAIGEHGMMRHSHRNSTSSAVPEERQPE